MVDGFQIGDRVDGRFDLLCEVASGGMGRIYRAKDSHDGRQVAVKVIVDEDEDSIARFDRESGVLARVRHPGIVRYVAHGRTGGGARYLAMEWLEGKDLKGILAQQCGPTYATAGTLTSVDSVVHDRTQDRTRLSVFDVVRLGRQLAAATSALHQLGVVHRDIKPSNVFAVGTQIERVKLLDFGTARLAHAPQSVTRTGALVGTPSYMAPEQVRGEKELTAAVDIWAVGALLYECLAGDPPFVARHLAGVLTKIVIDDPPDIRDLRPDLPDLLAEIVMSALSKEPLERPADGQTLGRRLEAVVVEPAPRRPVPVGDRVAITRSERRVQCLLLAQRVRLEPQLVERAGVDVAACGAELTELPDGSLLVTPVSAQLPTDQAMRVARAGLALRRVLGELQMAMALGRAANVQTNLVGDAIDRAVNLLPLARPGEIRLDPAVSEILDARFEVARDGLKRTLAGEREAEATRTLLGRRSTWVGRKREMVTLRGIFEECVEDPVARAVLVTGSAGAGKSRLHYEFVKALRVDVSFELLVGRGDSVSAGSPFSMIAPAIRRYAGILAGEPLESSRRKLQARVLGHFDDPATSVRVTEFLGELIGVPFEERGREQLAAARKDPMLMGDAMRSAFVEWLGALTNQRPVVFVLEDLHWGDLPTVQYIDAALRSLHERPLMVFALARPEIAQKFPSLWSERALQQIRLDALSKAASRKLVRHMLGEGVDPQTEALIVERAAGNAFYLEELIRAVASGADQRLPDSVVGMLQARFDDLGDEAKRVLRAASVFGEVFWAEGVDALLGQAAGTDAFAASDWLKDLTRREIIAPQPQADFPGRQRYKFRHALVRDAAYELLTDDDRRLGHRLAGFWLEAQGETDPLALAEHFTSGDEPVRGRTWVQRAAASALEGNDLDAVVERADRAVAMGASGEALGQLRLMQSIACYWRSDYTLAHQYGVGAAESLSAGSSEWFRAVGNTIVAAARRGDYDAVEQWFSEAQSQTPTRDAAPEQVVSLCRGCFQLIFAGRFQQADAILDSIASLVRLRGGASALDPLTLAQVEHVRGVRAAHGGDVGRFLVHLEAAVEAFERAGDLRNVSLERPTVGWCFAEVGMFEEAEAILRDALELCARLGAEQTITYAQVNLGYVLGHRGRPDDAVSLLIEAAKKCENVGNLRLEGWARAHISGIEFREGRYPRAEREAARAAELLRLSPGLQAWALAQRARALVAVGRASEAVSEASAAMDTLRRLGSMLQGESTPPLALIEATAAAGDTRGAALAAEDAVSRLRLRAERLPKDAWRDSFLRRPDNAAIEALGRTYQVDR